MKKIILLTSVIAIFAAVIFNARIKEVVNPEKPVSKDISLAVYAGGNYSASVYDASKAQLHVTISKMKGHRESILWQKTFDAMELKNIPSECNAISQIVHINNVFEKKEELIVTYTLTYDSKGSILQRYSGEVLAKGNHANKLLIGI